MKNKIYNMTLALLFMVGLGACSSDDLTDGYVGSSISSSNKQVEVTLNIGVQETEEMTRAATYVDGTTGENMYSWFVIIAQSGYVVDIVENTNLSNVTSDSFTLTLEEGTYDFYSFANIDRTTNDDLKNLSVGSALPTMSSLTYTVNGNGFVPSADNPIPMSNYQSITITASGESLTASADLWVVRMLAKIELQFTNATDEEITINSVTLSEITQNPSGVDGSPDNLMLLPSPLGKEDETACTPNLNTSSVKTADYTYTLTEALTVPANGSSSTDLTFYVNESTIPTENAHELFTLTVNCASGTYQRYALITNDNNEWNYIARNDYRIIPITLQEYKLAIEVYDYTPTGVYPASVNEEDGLFTATFHASGHFHVVPVVTKYGSTTQLPYYSSTATEYWKFDSWTNDEDDIPTGFYEEGDGSTVDTGENGGTPVWDDTNQYIFGYLADDTSEEVSKAYHDLTISIYNGSTTAIRTLTYHLCIVKKIAY